MNQKPSIERNTNGGKNEKREKKEKERKEERKKGRKEERKKKSVRRRIQVLAMSTIKIPWQRLGAARQETGHSCGKRPRHGSPLPDDEIP